VKKEESCLGHWAQQLVVFEAVPVFAGDVLQLQGVGFVSGVRCRGLEVLLSLAECLSLAEARRMSELNLSSANASLLVECGVEV
jgi:hypothetical protein